MNIENPRDLIPYLRERGHIPPSIEPELTILKGGISNRAVLVENDGSSMVLKQALPRLRVKGAWYSDPSRSNREAAGMAWLARLMPRGAVPRLLFQDNSNFLLAMEAVEMPHENWKELLLRGEILLEHVDQFAEMLAAIHAGSRAHLPELDRVFSDRSFFESLRLDPYYRASARAVPDLRSFLDELVERTMDEQLTLVHGDYSPKNILIHDGRLVLLDHEVVHFGDPAFDVGFSLTHLLSKANHRASDRLRFVEAAIRYWNHYSDKLGNAEWREGLEARAVKHTIACLIARVAGMSKLEYLGHEERDRQLESASNLAEALPTTVDELIERFLIGLRGSGLE